MRTKSILCVLILSLLALDAGGGPFSNRRAARQERRQPAAEYECGPNGCYPAQGGGSDIGDFKHLNPPNVALAPPPYEQRATVQPAQPPLANPPQAAAPVALDASAKARIDALIAEFNQLMGQTVPTTPVPPQPTPAVILEPTNPQPPATVVDDLGGVTLIVHDGTGKPVATAEIDFSELVRQQIGANK